MREIIVFLDYDGEWCFMVHQGNSTLVGWRKTREAAELAAESRSQQLLGRVPNEDDRCPIKRMRASASANQQSTIEAGASLPTAGCVAGV